MKNLAEKLLSYPTQRDLQRKIGPSTIGSPCDLCVAEALAATDDPTKQPERGLYWAGAAIGTAVHAQLEILSGELFPEMIPEMKVKIGELPGYGLISGTTDGVLVPGNHEFYPVERYTALDWKTTTRDKLVFLRQAFTTEPKASDSKKLLDARFKAQTYVGQTHMYARGLILGGVPVEDILISFIPRDAKTSADFWQVTLPYNEEYSNKVWERLVHIWENLTTIEWEAHPNCYPHNVGNRDQIVIKNVL